MRDYGTTNQIFGNNLRYLMKKKDVTFDKLERDTGIPHTSLHEYARGIRAVRLETAKHIAAYFGVTVDEMVEPMEGVNGAQG